MQGTTETTIIPTLVEVLVINARPTPRQSRHLSCCRADVGILYSGTFSTHTYILHFVSCSHGCLLLPSHSNRRVRLLVRELSVSFVRPSAPFKVFTVSVIAEAEDTPGGSTCHHSNVTSSSGLSSQSELPITQVSKRRTGRRNGLRWL